MPFRLAAPLGVLLALPALAAAPERPALEGEYECVYGCRLTDANPTIEIAGEEAACMNEFGGLYRGRRLDENHVACFRKTGELGADGVTLTWSDGVVWKRHGPMRR